MTIRTVIGDAPKRREDARFVTGRGGYLDDLAFDGVAHAVVLRSPHAHARIDGIDVAAARALPGVLAVLTAVDADADGLHPMRPTVEANVQTGEPFAFAPQPLLARGQGPPRRRAGGAGRRRDARPGAGCGGTHCGALCAAAGRDHRGGRASAAVRRRFRPRCRATSASTGVPAMPRRWTAAFAAAAHVVTLQLDNHRIVTNPMEPRGAVGAYDTCAGPLHAARLQPEHPRQSRRDGPRRWAFLPRRCVSSRRMSAAGSARRTSPTPNMR